jgi:hypothetical protein
MKENFGYLFVRKQIGLIDDSLPANMDWVYELELEKTIIEFLKNCSIYEYFDFFFKIFKIDNPNPLKLTHILGKQLLHHHSENLFVIECYNPSIQLIKLVTDINENYCKTIIFCINEDYINNVSSIIKLWDKNSKNIKLLNNSNILFDFCNGLSVL